MRKPGSAVIVTTVLCAALTSSTAALAQSVCTDLNRRPGEAKFTGQISSNPNGASMQVSYGAEAVLVQYNGAVTLCQAGQPASPAALIRGATVSVFGTMRGAGNSAEMEATRIFIAGPPRTSANMPATASGTTPGPAPIERRSASAPASPTPAPFTQQTPLAGTSPSANSGPLRTQQATVSQLRFGVIPNSVILTGGTHAEAMQRLHVVRTYSLATLRTNSELVLGPSRVDFQPVLANPQALFNVADRLREMPQHVEVRENTSEITEVDQGLVIHHVLTYRILPGRCADPAVKTQLARAGVACFTRATVEQRVAEFSTPGTARYIADPGKRQTAIAQFRRNIAAEEADANNGIAQLRRALADPSQRAAIAAQAGQSEATRLATLNDDQLKEELINSAVQHFEDTMFVPKLPSSRYLHAQHVLTPTASSGEMNETEQLLRNGVPQHGAPGNYPRLLKIVPPKPLNLGGAGKAGEADLGTYYFLTGFTIGNDYEWSWGAQVTINWCIVGCSSTYGLELHAGFNYGFGLRFPIQAELTYHGSVNAQNSAVATLTADVTPIEGNAAEFSSAGLSADQMFDAKEIVAQIGADAGFDLSLPGINVNPDFSLGVDFTNYLPAPYTGGHFQPPAPGSGGINSVLVLNGIDLLGGLLNYGVAGGQLLPAVKVNLHSDKLQLTLHDETQNRETQLTHTPQTVPVAVSSNAGTDISHFSLGNPVYNLGFTVTPGFNPQVFVDIDVWSHQWNWQIWFPQLSVSLPPNGIDFSCHSGTTCVLDFQTSYNPNTGQVSGKGQNVTRERQVAYSTLTGGGCTADSEQQGDFLCPLNGMYGLCVTMLNNGAVASCGALVVPVVDHILRNGHCTGSAGNYSCPKGMMGLCETYIKNRQVLACKQSP